jgi:hypothetical protein
MTALLMAIGLSDLLLLTMYALGEMPESRLHPNNRYQEASRKKCYEIISLLQTVAPQLQL